MPGQLACCRPSNAAAPVLPAATRDRLKLETWLWLQRLPADVRSVCCLRSGSCALPQLRGYLTSLYCSPTSWLVEHLFRPSVLQGCFVSKWLTPVGPQRHSLLNISLNICAAGLLDLRCLQLARNAVRSRLELRTLAALPQLQDLTLAGNPVVAGMPERQRRILLWHMLPGQCPAALQCLMGAGMFAQRLMSSAMLSAHHVVAHMLSGRPEALRCWTLHCLPAKLAHGASWQRA